jgi:hypothetical protein
MSDGPVVGNVLLTGIRNRPLPVSFSAIKIFLTGDVEDMISAEWRD